MLLNLLYTAGQVASLAALCYGAWTVLQQEEILTPRFWLAKRLPALPFGLAAAH